jgi:LuxR family transcriptional regulator, maltose regulon positive regulatory protein
MPEMTVAAGSRARAAAASWAQEHDLGRDNGPADPREGESLVLARVLLAQDLAGRALALLARLLAAATVPSRPGSAIGARARPTLAQAADGEEARAVLALAEAFALGYLERHPGDLRASGPAHTLTPRERQVLGLLAAGQANRDIADELVISLDTVKRHVSHILAKLAAANRTEAVARARDLNLIP